MMTLISMGPRDRPAVGLLEGREVALVEHAAEEEAGEASKAPPLEPAHPRHDVAGVEEAPEPLEGVEPPVEGGELDGEPGLQGGVLAVEEPGGPGPLLFLEEEALERLGREGGLVVVEHGVPAEDAAQPQGPEAEAEVQALPPVGVEPLVEEAGGEVEEAPARLEGTVERPGLDDGAPADDPPPEGAVGVQVGAEEARGRQGVAVHEHDHLASGLPDGPVPGGRHAGPAVQPEGADRAGHAGGERAHHVPRLVGRRVVHDEDLVAAGVQGLGGQRLQAPRQHGRPVPGGGDDAQVHAHGAGAGIRPASSSSWARTRRLYTPSRSALRTVDSRWATMKVVRPQVRRAMASWIASSDSLSRADVASSRM